MVHLPILSGQELVRILCKNFGFFKDRISGSHCLLKGLRNGKMKTIPVPLYNELGKHLLSRILKEAEISREEFFRAYRN
ncbi:type II toxin-antitoxin system HicA family toxin [Candidatus Micrarchaeota archaeon]|nr:type II toxin-antitoxin system HicA family toxin [Candidatus Micrarchaeota archaeon]